MAARRRKTETVEQTSPDLVAEQVERLKELFPECVAEGKVDFERLKATLGEIVDDRPERYSFTWAGKRDAIRLLQVPSRATLKPCPEESVAWASTKNVFIEGENLEVLKLLYKSYAGRVKMIYIDPPYNTGNDFIYPDNFADPLDYYLKLTGQKDAEGNLLTSNPETSGRYHSAWLSMMYPRLFVARQLLEEEGLIFISVDDNELANLVALMNEVFGEENRIAIIAWEKRFTRSNNARLFASTKDSIVVYRKSANVAYLREGRTEKSDSIYSNPDDDPRGPWTSVSYVNPATKEKRPNLVYSITNPFSKEEVAHPTHAWKYEKARCERHVRENRLWWGKDGGYKYPRLKKFLSEVSDGIVPVDIWPHKEAGTTDEGSKELAALIGPNLFDNPKPSRLIAKMLRIASMPESEDIVLDFFAGSATAAQAVLDLNREDCGNRRFVVVQLPEPTSEDSPAHKAGHDTIADIGKERIRRVIKKLKDEAKGGKSLFKDREAPEDLGFRVFELVESNYRQWRGVGEKDGEKYADEMDLFTDPLLPGWKPEDVIWEVALKEGYSVSCTVEEIKGIKGNHVWQVTDSERDQSFRVCLDKKIKEATVRTLALGKDDLFVCRDAALTDEQAANLALTCRLRTI